MNESSEAAMRMHRLGATVEGSDSTPPRGQSSLNASSSPCKPAAEAATNPTVPQIAPMTRIQPRTDTTKADVKNDDLAQSWPPWLRELDDGQYPT